MGDFYNRGAVGDSCLLLHLLARSKVDNYSDGLSDRRHHELVVSPETVSIWNPGKKKIREAPETDAEEKEI